MRKGGVRRQMSETFQVWRKQAEKIAKIEKKYNIRATYFIQSYLLLDNINLLQDISDLGHEVSYHCDVLDSNKGDMTAAIEEFSDTISKFQKYGFEVNTDPNGSTYLASTLNKLNFSGFSSLFPFYGKTKQLQYFQTALTDSELEQLTSWVSFSDMAEGQQYSIQ